VMGVIAVHDHHRARRRLHDHGCASFLWIGVPATQLAGTAGPC
jgi:hypothetical protein